MNKIEKIHLEVVPKSSLACFEDTQQESAKKSAEITTDVAVKFLEFVENNYYYNSGCWLNCETDEVKIRKNIFEEFINNHYGK
jgi:hypothetical protein